MTGTGYFFFPVLVPVPVPVPVPDRSPRTSARHRPLLLGLTLLLATTLPAGEKDSRDKPRSGIQEGWGVPAFLVRDITGPHRDKQNVCYVCENGSLPVVLIFTREIDGDIAALVRAVGGALKGEKDASAFLVLLDDGDEKAAADKLRKLAAETGATFPLAVNDEGAKTLRSHKLDPTVKHTILVYRGKVVVRNFALDGIREADVKEIVSAARKNVAAFREGTGNSGRAGSTGT
jgi:hypothetical protein